MELTKYKSAAILAHIKHDLRQLPPGKSYGNESVDSKLSGENYSLISRGKTAAEVNTYRKNYEKEVFRYQRKNLVHAVELVIQCPNDCPPEQHEAFFKTSFDWYCDTYLPAGKDCVFIAEVHKDEHKYITVLENGKEVQKDISKEHLHIAYVPVIPAGNKHPNYKYRLNADALTKRSILRDMHPSLQAALNKAGITATVQQNKSGSGKSIPLTVKQLKEITERTGVVIDHTLTLEELAEILHSNIELNHKVDLLATENSMQHQDITKLNEIIQEKDLQIRNMQITIDQKTEIISAEHNRSTEEAKKLQEQIKSLKEALNAKELELQQEHQEHEVLKSIISTTEKEHTWGTDSTWGSNSGWDSTNTPKSYEEEKLW